MYHLPIYTTRNVKGSPSGIKEMVTGGNMDLYKGVKTTGDSSYTVNT